jgi:DNA polymerase V
VPSPPASSPASPPTWPLAAAPLVPSRLEIDLQQLLIPDPERTVLLRVGGDSMQGAGIQPGDLLVVERNRSPRSGQVVVALLAEGFTLKRLAWRQQRWLLEAAHPAYPALALGDGLLWGVATHVIRSLPVATA